MPVHYNNSPLIAIQGSNSTNIFSNYQIDTILFSLRCLFSISRLNSLINPFHCMVSIRNWLFWILISIDCTNLSLSLHSFQVISCNLQSAIVVQRKLFLFFCAKSLCSLEYKRNVDGFFFLNKVACSYWTDTTLHLICLLVQCKWATNKWNIWLLSVSVWPCCCIALYSGLFY